MNSRNELPLSEPLIYSTQLPSMYTQPHPHKNRPFDNAMLQPCENFLLYFKMLHFERMIAFTFTSSCEVLE